MDRALLYQPGGFVATEGAPLTPGGQVRHRLASIPAQTPKRRHSLYAA